MTPPPPSVSLDNETTSRMGGGGEDASSQFASAGPRSKLKSRQLHPKPIFDESLVYERTDELGISRMHVKKLWRTIIHHGLVNEDIHTRLPALLFPHSPRKLLGLLQSGEFAILTSRLVKRSDARDGSTTKLLIELQDGQRVESVIMRYGAVELDSFPMEEKKRNNNVEEEVVAKDEIEGEVRVQHDEGFDSTNTTPFSDTASIRSTTTTATTSTRSQRKRDRPKLQGPFRCHRRATVCVSSQVGCAMACTFCATGTMGLLGNLTSGEILEQLFHANSIEQIRGVVFMGMGEPLDNYTQVIRSINGMTDSSRFSLAASRITISTVGVVNRIHSLIKDAPHVGLALSLHAPTHDLRNQIVPTTKAWSIDRIMAATNAFIENQKTLTASYAKRHCLIEYVLIDGVNDSIETAHALGALLQGCSVLLNVIPYNPTAVPFDYKPPTMAAQTAFVAVTRDVYGVKTILRQTMGQDVSAACGQLVIEQRNIKKPVASCSSGGDDGSVEEEEKKTKKNGDGVVDLEDLLAKTAGKSNTTRVKIAEAATTLRKRNINSSSAIAASNTVEESGRDSGSLVQHALFLIVIASLISLVLFRQFTNNQ